MTLLIAGLVVVGVYLTAYVAYQCVLFLVNVVVPDPVTGPPSGHRRFNVMIPAHEEEVHLPRLLQSLAAQRYPADRYRVTVIADNCTDRTAEVARGFDVDVLERSDPTRRNKGFALAWALERVDLARFDALLVVDGDSFVNAELLAELNLQLERGDKVIQCYNAVANPDRSWFTRLMNVSRTIGNDILHPAKRKLGLSSYLQGNGMCFSTEVLRQKRWSAFTIGEDWEYYAQLVLAGVDVGYSRLAHVYHQESTGLRQASRQRLRWSSGRMQVLRSHGLKLFALGLRTGRFKYVDASLPLVFPNPSLAVNITLAGAVLAALVWFSGGGAAMAAWYAALIAVQLVLFVIGAFYTKRPWMSVASIVAAPVFLVWKLGIDVASMMGLGAKTWTATEREPS